MKTITNLYRVNYPNVSGETVSFKFTCNMAPGLFGFEFKFLSGGWHGWATLPTGEVREFGCVPDVIDWTEFTDYGVLIDSQLSVFGQSDLVAHSTLYLVTWGAV